MIHIAGVPSKALKVSAPASAPASALASVPAPGENPPVTTSLLYVAGHRLNGHDVCPDDGAGVRLLVLVTTAPSHAQARRDVRGTWGHMALRRDVAFAFFVGVAADEADNRAVAQENELYGDIIQVRRPSLDARCRHE